MRSWNISDLGLRRTGLALLFSSEDSRAFALRLAAGEQLADRPVPERAWIMPLSGQIEIVSSKADAVRGGPGLVVELSAKERHGVVALEDTDLLLLLTSGPKEGRSPAGCRSQRPSPKTEPLASSKLATDEDPLALDPLSPLP
jgi:hypothetical protein